MKSWKITFGDHVWTDEQAIVGHVTVLTETLGINGWDAVSPWNSPTILAAWLAVLIAADTGNPIDDCIRLVQSLRLSDLLETLAER